MDRTLTRTERKLLFDACESNGGGVQMKWLTYSDRARSSLIKRGLIKVKSGHKHMLIHTPEGLAMYREIIKAKI
jgi:hypothetical protein